MQVKFTTKDGGLIINLENNHSRASILEITSTITDTKLRCVMYAEDVKCLINSLELMQDSMNEQ